MELHYRYDVNGNLASITRVKADGTKFTLYAICNSRGDVEELRQLNGSLYARYVYDTWGNTLHIYDANGAEITSTANLAVQNPIRYRGYYFDSETGLYYLQSRYYDPIICRFLNADSYVSTGTGIIGFNMFSYCNNNPVLYVDITGMMHVKGTDACGTSSFDEVFEVYSSEKYSYYKGVLVVRHNIDFLTSWSYGGIIFLNHNLDAKSYDYKKQYLNHEYGHILQEKRLGTIKYAFAVAVPSTVYNLLSRSSQTLRENYYNMPWEYDADLRGKVDRTHKQWAFKAYFVYFSVWRGLL